MDKGELVSAIATTILGSSVINGIVTHILYNSKLAKERKAKGNDVVANQIQKSLEMFRELELELKTIEIYQIEEELEEKGSSIDLVNPGCTYPAIFNDWVSYNTFKEHIQNYRKEYEKYLSCELALMLVFIDRYINQLGLYMAEHGDESMLPDFGAIFVYDLQLWRTDIDKKLVKEINKVTYKLESHEGKKWGRKRKKVLEKRWEQTLLYYLLYGKCSRKHRRLYKIGQMLLECMYGEND